MRARQPLIVATFTAWLLGPSAAFAYDANVDADTTAQAYQLRGITGDPVISRRRLTQTIALSVDHIGDELRAEAPQVFFRARLRLDADFGISNEEAYYNARNPAARFVPGLAAAPVDLMYGYLEGRRFLRGLLAFKVGRQVVVDPLGYYAFDGGMVRVTTPLYFSVEAYGGFEVRAGLPLSGVSNTAPSGELGGVLRGDRSGMPSSAYPSYQSASPAPVYAVALETSGPTWVHGRLTYRSAWNTGSAVVANGNAASPDQVGFYDKLRASSERLGYALNLQPFAWLGAHGDLVYDFIYGRFTTADVGLESNLGKHVALALDWSYWQPTFDADSIFNVFGFEPMDDLSARIEVTPTDRLDVSADARVRIYRNDDPASVNAATLPTGGSTAAVGAIEVAKSYAPGVGLRARYKLSRGRIGFRGSALWGDQGHRVGGDATYERQLGTRWSVDGRLSLFEFEDRLRADPSNPNAYRHALSFGYVLGGGYRLSDWSTAQLQWEHDTNRLVGQRFRLLAILNVKAGL